MKKVLIATSLSVFLISGCAANGAKTNHGFYGFLKGIGHLILSPIQIAAGLLEGVASLPYYVSTSLHDINKGLEDAQAAITLDDTYESAYGKRINEVSLDGDTNERFRRMKHASNYLQKVLKQHGVIDHQNYYLTSIDTANRSGSTLFAVVYRPLTSISVVDKYNHRRHRDFTTKDRLFYEPFQHDVNGNQLDRVIDWAGVPVDTYRTQKMQAVLLTLAANAIIDKKTRHDYWKIEKRWIDGEFEQIMRAQNSKTRRSMML